MDIIEVVIPIVAIIGFIFSSINYKRSWDQLEAAFKNAGLPWHHPNQEYLNEVAKKSPLAAQKIIWGSILGSLRLVWGSAKYNSDIGKAIRKVRISILSFVLLPLLLVLILLTMVWIQG